MNNSEFGNIVSVSWTDHLVFGKNDGKLDTPGALDRRMISWRNDLGAKKIHWRLLRTHITGRFRSAPGHKHSVLINSQKIKWNDLDLVPIMAHNNGLKAYLYVSIFDEGWPLGCKKDRKNSYHNLMHGQHSSWQSDFSLKHPEYALEDRTSQKKQWGVLCLAYPEVRSHFCERFLHLLKERKFDGLFVCLRSQSKPADFADQFGFNTPIRNEFYLRHKIDIATEDFDLQAWRDLAGEYITKFIFELKTALTLINCRLAVGVPRGDILGPPLGNTSLAWQEWVSREIIDELIINQNSSQCPSMWHDLWPMHRGYGYYQNYMNGRNLPSLIEHIESSYSPLFQNRPVDLYIARQWDKRERLEEKKIIDLRSIKGLVFSSFRHDNPDAVERNDWRI